MMPRSDIGTGAGKQHVYLRTTCGRELTIGRLSLGDTRHPAARVFLDLGSCPGCDSMGWAGFTVAEARQLAHAIMSQAAAAELACTQRTATTDFS